MPLGLERVALVPMGWGLDAILWVARTTAALPRATLDVPHMPAWGLALVGLGMAWLGLWRGRIRLAGAVVLAAGLVSPAIVRPPDLLVSADARMVGVRTPAGMFVERKAGASKFTRDAWRQYWADGPPMRLPQVGQVADGAIACTADACTIQIGPGPGGLLLRNGKATDCALSVLVTLGWERGTACHGVPTVDRACCCGMAQPRSGWKPPARAWSRTGTCGGNGPGYRRREQSRPWTPDLPLAPAGA